MGFNGYTCTYNIFSTLSVIYSFNLHIAPNQFTLRRHEYQQEKRTEQNDRQFFALVDAFHMRFRTFLFTRHHQHAAAAAAAFAIALALTLRFVRTLRACVCEYSAQKLAGAYGRSFAHGRSKRTRHGGVSF